jgi:hypothetical protein
MKEKSSTTTKASSRFAHESFRALTTELNDLGAVAKALGVSKSEALRRCIRISLPVLRKNARQTAGV